MARLKALKNQTYRTRRLKAGDEFEEPSRRYAELLRRLRRAEDAPAEEPKAPTRKRAQVEEPEPAPRAQVDEDAGEVTATVIRRMRKNELAAFLRQAGQDVDEEAESRDDLVEWALALLR